MYSTISLYSQQGQPRRTRILPGSVQAAFNVHYKSMSRKGEFNQRKKFNSAAVVAKKKHIDM